MSEITRLQIEAEKCDQDGLLAGDFGPKCACVYDVCVCDGGGGCVHVCVGRGLDETALRLLLLHEEEVLSQRLLKRFIKEMAIFLQRMAGAFGVSMQELVEDYGVPKVACDPRTLKKAVERNQRLLVCTTVVYS